MFKKLLLGLILLVGSLVPAVAQNQYFASTTGSGSACTQGSPCSLATAMSTFTLANPGGAVINLAPGAGSYGSFSLSRGGSSSSIRLTLKCTSLSNSGNTCKFTQINTFGVNNVDIGALPFGGFEITNPGGNVAIDNVCNSCGGSNSIHALGNYMHNIGTTDACGDLFSAAFLGGGSSKSGADDDTIVAGNRIDLIGNASCGSVNTMHGIYVSTTPAQIYDNLITRVVIGAAVQAYHLACRFRISNNVFLNDHIGLILYSTTNTAACTPGLNTVDNNVIANSVQQGVFTSGNGDCTSGFPTLFSNNNMFGNAGGNFNNTAAACETRANPKAENPNSSFVNNTGTATGDYHLQGNSVLVNGGTKQCTPGGPTPCTPSTDIAGNTFNGSTPAIGIYTTGGLSIPSPPTGLNVIIGPFSGFDQVAAIWQPVCISSTCNGGVSPPSATSQTFGVGNPSLDGSSMELSITSGPVAAAAWPVYVTSNDGTTSLTLDIWFYPNANPNLLRSFEFDNLLYAPSLNTNFTWGLRCSQGTGFWEILTNPSGAIWTSTGTVCSVSYLNWHHLQFNVHRVAGDTNSCAGEPCQYYDSFNLDGNLVILNQTAPANFPSGATSAVGFQFLLNVGSSGSAGTTVDYDKVFMVYR